jgi:hypothetical protein
MMLLPMMMPWARIAMIAVATSGFVAAGVQTLRLASSRASHIRDVSAIQQAQQNAINEAQMRANQAAHRYEEWKMLQRPKIIRITKEVDNAIQANPNWSTQPLPDSVRDAIQAAGTDDATTKPEPAMPAVGQASTENKR